MLNIIAKNYKTSVTLPANYSISNTGVTYKLTLTNIDSSVTAATLYLNSNTQLFNSSFDINGNINQNISIPQFTTA